MKIEVTLKDHKHYVGQIISLFTTSEDQRKVIISKVGKDYIEVRELDG